MIRGGSTTIYITDMDQAIHFYHEVLGLPIKVRYGAFWAEIDAGDGCILSLHPATPHAPPPGTAGAVTIGLLVTQPLEEVVAALTQRGVVFHGPIQGDPRGPSRLAFFSDTDGNPLYLCELPQNA